jgi:hypothetical protein
VSAQVDGRLAVVEEPDRVLVVREDDPTDWLCAFAKGGDFPAGRWARNMARTYNERLELSRAKPSFTEVRHAAGGPPA